MEENKGFVMVVGFAGLILLFVLFAHYGGKSSRRPPIPQSVAAVRGDNAPEAPVASGSGFAVPDKKALDYDVEAAKKAAALQQSSDQRTSKAVGE